MVVNIKLAPRFDIDTSGDTVLRRAWAGWDETASETELWSHNRGRHRFSARVDEERYASLSFGGTIRLVAEITGREPAPDRSRGGDRWALIGNVLPPGHPVREALIGEPDQTTRGIRYLPDPSGDGAGAKARVAGLAGNAVGVSGSGRGFLLTHNSDHWDMHPDEVAEWIDATAAGRPVMGRWSIGNRKKGIGPGDRAFLLRQGSDIRGIVASGTVDSDIIQAEHWLDPSKFANYVDVRWDTVIDFEDPLAVVVLQHELPAQHWEPQSSGNEVRPEVLERLEALWAKHAGVQPSAGGAEVATDTEPGRRRSGQRWMRDPILRKKVEDAAQDRLMQHYAAQGYDIEDTRFGNPFDARATKGEDVLYLEAKGTVTAGESVIVTRGEVHWARNHLGQCVVGILSDIRFTPGGDIDPDSGNLWLLDWEPDEDDLDPLTYTWTHGADIAP